MGGHPQRIGLGKASDVRATLSDLCSLIRVIGSRPTNIRELVVDMPRYVGYHDAAAEGARGVWFSLNYDMPPLVWHLPFPDDIATEVVTIVHPHGKVTNADLELTAEVLAIGTLLAVAPVIKWEPLGTLCDNNPTVICIEKMVSQSISPTAGRLLRGLAFLLHSYHSGRLTTVHVPGKDNIMADIGSQPSKPLPLFAAKCLHSLTLISLLLLTALSPFRCSSGGD
jgi:hypothetical protein